MPDRRPENATHNDTRFMGEWDEWKHLYDQLPVVTRQALAHLHGKHENLTMHCPLCVDPETSVAVVRRGVESGTIKGEVVEGRIATYVDGSLGWLGVDSGIYMVIGPVPEGVEE